MKIKTILSIAEEFYRVKEDITTHAFLYDVVNCLTCFTQRKKSDLNTLLRTEICPAINSVVPNVLHRSLRSVWYTTD